MTQINQLNADYYHEQSSLQKSKAKALLKQHAIRADEIILDVGCGDGAITYELASLCPEGSVTGIDASDEMIDYANQHYANKCSNLTFERITCEDYTNQERFTLVTSFNALYWCRNLPQAIENIAQSLKSGGHFLGVIFPAESPYWDIFRHVLLKNKWNKYYTSSLFNADMISEQYLETFRTAGLSVKSFDLLELTIAYHDKQAFLDFVNGWLPCLFTAPRDEHEDYLDEVYQLAMDMYQDPDQHLVIPYTQLDCYLVK